MNIKQAKEQIKNAITAYFTKDDFCDYLLAIANCSSKIDQWYGVKTIQLLNKKKYGLLRLELEKKINDYILKMSGFITYKEDFEEMFNKSNIILEENNCKEIFVNNNRICYFLGEDEISKCFITSEYLIDIYTNETDVVMDYTTIICGYLKSIEILISDILKTSMLNRHIYKDKDKLIPLDSKDIDNMTLDKLINTLFLNSNNIIKINDYKKYLKIILLRYKDECRNSHFHKDIIDEKDVSFVHAVRNNTLYLYCILLTICNINDYFVNKPSVINEICNSN